MTDEQKAVDEMAENQNVKNIQNIINNAIANNHGIINYNGMSVIYCAIDLHKAHYRPEAEARADTVKEFAKKLKEVIDEYSTKVIGSEWSDSEKLLHSITCETIYNKINKIAEQYGKEEK